MTQEELIKKILDHKLWLNSEFEEGRRFSIDFVDIHNLDIYLSSVNLTKAHFSNSNLNGMRLYGACLKDATLYYSSFIGTDLGDTDFRGAMFRKSNLNDSNLKGSNFEEADLSNIKFVNANLERANLKGTYAIGTIFRKANLKNANFKDARLEEADFNEACVEGAIFDIPNIPYVENLLYKVAKVALEPNALNMENWHTCDTTHCIAGWTCFLAKVPKSMEIKYSTRTLAALLLIKSGVKVVPDFYSTNEVATEFLKKVIENNEHK